ncbi:MAG: acyl-CoA reductase-like NAD-dependent aldehyde dehydrogenase [Candidatus Azotimanducaceae bacterium]|jgi:acyl-CoA reductase-like NAD-dependent aldehyde dehydrogenase
MTLESNREKLNSFSIQSKAFIDGQFVDSASGKKFDSISPSSGLILASVAECEEEDVNRAVRAAKSAFESGLWRNMAPMQRKKMMLKWADLMEKHAAELALLDVIDMGKPIKDAMAVDIPGTITCFRWYAEAIDNIYDEIAPSDPGRVVMIMREPLGVIGCVVTWNFSLLMTSLKIVPALIAGNSVVLKPAEQSPLSALRLAELAAEAGIPNGVFNVILGYGPTAGEPLGRHADVDCLCFTGSTEIGKRFMGYSAESNMKPVHLE